jgi:hypothetical protein
MAFVRFRFNSSLKSDNPCFISITKTLIRFSSEFVRISKIDSEFKVLIYIDHEIRKIRFEFSKSELEDSLTLTRQQGKTNLQCSATKLYKEIDWLRSIANLSGKGRQVIPKKIGNGWEISLIPSFEISVLRLDSNNLTTLPPIFPNSIQTLRLDYNDITGYTSNFPTSCIYFDMSDIVGTLQTVPQWSVDLTGSTSLETFKLDSVGLSGWTTQFPLSIKTISFRSNLLENFDFNYTTGATSIDLYDNNLTGTTNLSGHTSITGLTIGSNNFTDGSQVLGGDFPSTLMSFNIGGSPLLTGWTNTFSAMTNMSSLNFQNTNLKTAAVDYILQDVATIAVANNLYNKTLNLSGTLPNQPQSPTGGVTNADYLLLTSSPYNWTVTITP